MTVISTEVNNGFYDKLGSILTVLPFSNSSYLINKEQKRNVIHLINEIIKVAQNALRAFQSEKLECFDPQVGENLCQIRAYQLTLLANKYRVDPQGKKNIDAQIEILKNYHEIAAKFKKQWDQSVKNTSKYNKNLDARETVEYFLRRNELLVPFSQDILTLIACFFLSLFSEKKNGILQSICLKTVSKTFEISKSQAKRLVQAFQNCVCHLGYQFIHNMVERLPEYRHYKNILPTLFMDSDDARHMLPCFLTSEFLFFHALKNHIPIFLIIHRKGYFLKEKEVIAILISGENIESPKIVDYREYLTKFCMVIEGEVDYQNDNFIESVSEYMQRLLKINPIISLLANTAIHPQYAGKKLSHLKDSPYDKLRSDLKLSLHQSFNAMRDFAKQHGCSKENAKTLFMKHAYAFHVGEVVQQLSKYTNAYACTASSALDTLEKIQNKENKVLDTELIHQVA